VEEGDCEGAASCRSLVRLYNIEIRGINGQKCVESIKALNRVGLQQVIVVLYVAVQTSGATNLAMDKVTPTDEGLSETWLKIK